MQALEMTCWAGWDAQQVASCQICEISAEGLTSICGFIHHRSMNLLTDSMFSVARGKQLSLAELLAAMAAGEIKGFLGLRPHQRPAWHMFLVQLAALALWRSELDQLPTSSDQWLTLLRLLTPGHEDDAPWTLVVADQRKPAFLQPPVPDQSLKWSAVGTPDALDMLITSRNHDLKQEVAQEASAEDWVFALVSLQTMDGYGGRGHQGIARMNGGHSSRPMLGLAPAKAGDTSVDPSAWWARDVRRLLLARRCGDAVVLGTSGGPALLWCLDWPEGQELDLETLDPWFIEACRRVRLAHSGSAIVGWRSMSRSPRVAAKVRHGNVGDPWAPVHQSGKSLTLGGGEFDYSRLTSLMFSGEWTVPYLARPGEDERDGMLIVAEAFSRGNNKTEGFKSRVVPAPGHAVRLFGSPTRNKLVDLAQTQVKEIEVVHSALRYALALAAAQGVRSAIKRSHYAFSGLASKRFNRAADQAFFPSLWRRFDAASIDDASRFGAKVDFLVQLKAAAIDALDTTLPTVPCSAVYRTRTAIRAHRAFMGRLRADQATRDMFAEESTDET